ncbi:MAG: methylamine utilization protein [Amphiplicatus sp.]
MAGAVWLAAMTGASGAELRVSVRDEAGAPVADAVVTLATVGARSAPRREPYLVDQRSEEFLPLVTLLRPGDSIQFANSDSVFHHVYSFASMNRFEFVVKPGDVSPIIKYDTVGVAAIGCNVHDNMITYAVVTEAPYAAKTDKAGLAVIADAPRGAVKISAWHPRARANGKTTTQDAVIDEDKTLVELVLPLAVPRKSRGAHRY